ncbi:hypothetical protein IQ07DRAFT_650814 [Pyrenochaeta sp. DS3sAY3a]|nr:hypothetical protein IQ07DRAFT_650814 [Pyrenochaeta sp. DS3sAY3a]
MYANIHSHKWVLLASLVLLLAAIALCFLCVLSGVRPGWLSDYHIVRISAFQDALEQMVDTVPALGRVFGTTLDKLLEKTGVPESIAIYATSYCSQSHKTDPKLSAQCFSHGSSRFDIATGLRIAMAMCYALSIASAVVSLAFWLHWMRRDSEKSRHRAKACTWIACGAVGFASTTTTVVAYAVYMVLAKNVPQAVLSVKIGSQFLTLTWLACMCLVLALAMTQSLKMPYAQQLH